MNPFRLLSSLLIASTVFLAIGAVILRIENLVPVTLTYSTFLVILGILAVAHFTWRENFITASLGAVLAVFSIVFNTMQPAHISAILHPFTSLEITVLVFSDVIGFYLLPAAYLLVYLVRYRKLRTFSALSKLQSTG